MVGRFCIIEFPLQRGEEMAIFITATDTNVGKTLFSMGFILKYAKSKKYGYIKPFQSGDKDENDTEIIKSFADPLVKIHDPIYSFTYPASPFYAATLEKTKIDLGRVEKTLISLKDEKLLIEGAGGVLVPIAEKTLYIDLIQNIKIPVLLICKTSLGTINHTLLTIEALKNRNINILGFFSFGKLDALGMDNIIYIERYSGIKHIGSMEIPEEFITRSIREHLLDKFELSNDFLSIL